MSVSVAESSFSYLLKIIREAAAYVKLKTLMLTRNKQNGFTIVELLIVVVIIGILAAIVIVAYNGVTNTAKQNTAKSDLASIGKKLGVYYATYGSFPATTTDLDTADMKINQTVYATNRNNLYYCRSTDGIHYSVGAVMTGNTIEFYLKDGVVTQLGAGNVNSVNNCTNIGFPAPAGSYAGYDFSTGTGWASWAQ
jgi:prepilin-type N-terminal cleavage/methylation domain-containing protein